MIVNIRKLVTGDIIETYTGVIDIDTGVANLVLIETERANYLIHPSPENVIEIIKD